MEGVHALHLGDDVEYLEAPEAAIADLERVHDPAYLRELEAFCSNGGGEIDADTLARPDSAAARRAAGAGLAAIDALRRDGDGVAFVAVRPATRHALVDRGMGFCLLNNVAVAAAALRAEGARVLIVDWDVHDGNGTEAIFWDDRRSSSSPRTNIPSTQGRGRPRTWAGPTRAG